MAKLIGRIVAIAPTGDPISDIKVADIQGKDPKEIVIKCEGHSTIGVFNSNHGQPEMTFVALENTEGNLQLKLVGDDASRFLGIGIGAEITVSWT